MAGTVTDAKLSDTVKRYGAVYGIVLLFTLIPFFLLPMGCTPNCTEMLAVLTIVLPAICVVGIVSVMAFQIRELNSVFAKDPPLAKVSAVIGSVLAAPLTVLLIAGGFLLLVFGFQLLLMAVYSIVHFLKLA